MDEKLRLWNLALASVYLWAQDPAAEDLTLHGVSVLPMGQALAILASESDERARGALRLAYVEAIRVFDRLDDTTKSTLRSVAQALQLPSPPNGGDHTEDANWTARLLSRMGPKREVIAYHVKKVEP